MADRDAPVLVGIPEIAEIAGVGRSAVGNWRKRHEDFPTPRVQTPSGALFDLGEIETWLIERGKLAQRVPVAQRLWAIADSARGEWSVEELASFLIAGLVYLTADRRASGEPSDLPTPTVPTSATWARVSEVDEEKFSEALLEAAAAIEAANPTLDGLLVPGLAVARSVRPGLARHILDLLYSACDDEPSFGLYEEAIGRLLSADRFAGSYSTPDDIVHLVTQLVDVGGGTFLDPTVGEGGLLMMAAIGEARDGERDVRLVGLDINADTITKARSRFFLYDIPVELRAENSLRADPSTLPMADAVLVDPPYGMRDWGDAETYLDERWTFGPPPPSSADLAWVQLAVNHLRPHGRAAVILPLSSGTRGGREARIRAALLEAHSVEAVIALPSRLRADTGIQVAVWLLRSPNQSDAPDDVLLVDASELVEKGRSRHSIPEPDINRLVALLRAWRANHAIDEPDTAIAWPVTAEVIRGSDAVLDPNRYRPTTPVDLDALRAEIADRKESLAQHLDQLDQAGRSLISLLEDLA